MLDRFSLAWRMPALSVLVLLLLVAEVWQHAPPPTPSVAVWPDQGPSASAAQALALQSRGQIPMPADTPAAHASTLVPMPAASSAALLAFWFAGQRESAPDVRIAFSWFDRASQAWQPARFVADRRVLGKELGMGIRRLGNPVGWRDAQGRIHLFVVATGLGGWAAGRVLQLRQKGPAALDSTALNALEFEAVGLLPLSWLWNTSHLVRSAPLPLADGGMWLPLYFELGIKYPLAARLGPDGRFVALERLSRRGALLQPSFVMLGPTDWLALLRDHGSARKIAVTSTRDGGETWQDQSDLPLDNPDASVAGLGLGPGALALAFNPSRTGRQRLDLAVSADGRHWSPLLTLAQGGEGSEYSYPALAWADDSLWVTYTDQRQRIAWVRLVHTASAVPPAAPMAPAASQERP